MAAEAFQYWELWDKLEAEGGVRLGFLGYAVRCQRRQRLNGDDGVSASFLKTHHLASSIKRGAVLRAVLSRDGTTVQEWPITKPPTRGRGSDLLIEVECSGVLGLLVNYPVSMTDGDGYVYREAPLVGVSPSTAITSRILSNTPAWLGAGNVTPSTLDSWPFSGDSALSGLRRMEEIVRSYEASARRNGGSQYLVDLTARGASAEALYLRAERNLRAFRREPLGGQVTRVAQIAGAAGDDGPATLAWAYWEVEATSGAGPYRVKLKSIHGGDGPIAFDDQLNHANLPGGANSLYLEKRDGTFIQITDSWATTQEVEVSALTTISVGDWVRVVASSTGKHLANLDAPAELATWGVIGGDFESPWDDFTAINKNAMAQDYSNPSSRPDNWTGVAATRTTTDGEYLSYGQGVLVNTSVSDGAQILAPPARSWYIRARRTMWIAGAWIRLRALLSAGSITLQLKVGSTVVGKGHVYVSPANQWKQLKIEGLDLSAYAGTTQTVTVEIVKSEGAGTVNMVVDSIWCGPAIGFRAPTVGSNPARIWQGVNGFLADRKDERFVARGSLLDLARLGSTAAADVVLGQTVQVPDDEWGSYTGRLSELVDDPQDPREAQVILSDLPARLSRKQVTPAELVIPYFEPIHIRAADRDNRNAAMLIKAEIIASDANSVSVGVTVLDTLGGSPALSYAVSSGVGFIGGSGTPASPWIFSRPASGAGLGRVVVTAKLAGRADVTDAVEITEQAAQAMVAKAVIQSTSAGQVVVRVTAAAGTSGGVTVTSKYEAGSLSVSPSSGGTFSSITNIDDTPGGGAYIDYTITRPAFSAGTGRVQFNLTATGYKGAAVSVEIPAQERDTIALAARLKLQTVNATTVVVRVAVADPFPPGGASVTVAYTLDPSGSVTPASGGTLTPTSDLGTTGYIDYTVDRPNSGAPARRFTATATDGTNGRIPATDSIDVPAQDGPTLDLKSEEVSGTQWKLTWSATGTVEVSKNGGAWTAPGSLSPALSSGTAFNRPDWGTAEDVYAFRVTNGGQTISSVANVPAVKTLTVTLSISQPQKNAGGDVDIGWSTTGMPSGTTYDVSYVAFDSSGAATGATGTVEGQSSSPWNQTPSPGFAAGDKWQVTVAAKKNGQVLATRTRFATVLT